MMYIPYEKIGNIIYKFFKNEKLKDSFYNLKLNQNIRYINKNKSVVLNKLKYKLKKGQKLSVVFYVYDETKWKGQSLYDRLNCNEQFNVKILVSKTSASNYDNPSYQSVSDVKKVYNYFKDKGLNVEYAYDITKNKFIEFEKFKPDIIFYQHPWYVERSQGPVVCSKFALTCYIPYYFPIETADIDCKLRFHKYVESIYILDKYTKQKYENKSGLKNLKVVGYPYLDYFNDKHLGGGEYIIYAPHWTIEGKGLAYGTFEWRGDFLLDDAKNYSESKWIFKPHPLLFKSLIDNKVMSKEEAENYYNEWSKLGIKYESGDYLKLFEQSKMMITDCSSFLGEYFVTGKPLIHLMSEKSQFNHSDNPILKSYYRAHNLEELKNFLNVLPNDDTMKSLRENTLKSLGFKNNNASQNIIDDILSALAN